MAEETCEECGLPISKCNDLAIRQRFEEREPRARRDFAEACRLFEDFFPGMNLETTGFGNVTGPRELRVRAYHPGEGALAWWPGIGETFEVTSRAAGSEVVVDLIRDMLDGKHR